MILMVLQGVNKQLDLPEPFNTDPSSLTAEDVKAAGLETLPTSLEAALSALQQDGGKFDGHTRVHQMSGD